MTEKEAIKILKDKGLAWGSVDVRYQPARWMVDAVIAAVEAERERHRDLLERTEFALTTPGMVRGRIELQGAVDILRSNPIYPVATEIAYLDEAKYLLQEGRRIGALGPVPKA